MVGGAEGGGQPSVGVDALWGSVGAGTMGGFRGGASGRGGVSGGLGRAGG